jgi:beta-galactosidase
MFDFGADARAEGGENGQNHKGLMTMDRKYKKDSFYAYKAWLNPEPMVHICGKRYVDRVEDVTKVTVYSNCESVELFANGASLGVQQHNGLPFFYFDVPNSGLTHLVAVAGELKDESVINKVEVFNEDYRLKEKNAVLNWFDITQPEGYLNLNCTFKQIMSTVRGKLLVVELFTKMAASMNSKDGKKKGPGFDISAMGSMMDMLGGFTFLRLAGMIGTMGINFTKEELLDINARLNKIKIKD